MNLNITDLEVSVRLSLEIQKQIENVEEIVRIDGKSKEIVTQIVEFKRYNEN